MRKQTEEYWRQKIATEIQNEINFQAWYNDQHGRWKAKRKGVVIGYFATEAQAINALCS